MDSSKKKIIIVAGPSGVGKSTFVDKVTRECPLLIDVVTYTTRVQRDGESQGDPYHFVGLEEFRRRESEGFFVETAEVHNNYYGTPIEGIEKSWSEGRVVIMDIDYQGARVFLKRFPWTKTIFISPPSIDVLRQRVLARDGHKAHDIDVRMETAREELRFVNEFEYNMVNQDYEASYAEFKKIVEEIIEA